MRYPSICMKCCSQNLNLHPHSFVPKTFIIDQATYIGVLKMHIKNQIISRSSKRMRRVKIASRRRIPYNVSEEYGTLINGQRIHE